MKATVTFEGRKSAHKTESLDLATLRALQMEATRRWQGEQDGCILLETEEGDILRRETRNRRDGSVALYPWEVV